MQSELGRYADKHDRASTRALVSFSDQRQSVIGIRILGSGLFSLKSRAESLLAGKHLSPRSEYQNQALQFPPGLLSSDNKQPVSLILGFWYH